MRPVPFGVWLCALTTILQGAATAWALNHEGDTRGVVMGVTFVIFLVLTITLYVRRPVVEVAPDEPVR